MTTPHRHNDRDLTRNQALVLATLTGADAPLSAYTILERLRDEGFRAPLQVYRALDKLRDYGLVHRLESVNAFVACQHPHHGTHHVMTFAICESCGGVTEFEDDAIGKRLDAWAHRHNFATRQTTIEISGLCESCATAAEA